MSYSGIYMPKSKSYAEKWRIWSKTQELERQHEAYKQYRIEEYNRRKMRELRDKDRGSGKSSHRRGRQSHSKSRSREGSREIRLSDSQLKTLEAQLRKDLFRKIGATISEGREDTESRTRTGNRGPRKTDRKHSSQEPGPSHDRRDSQPSTSTRHLDVELSRRHRSRSRSRNRNRSPKERDRRSPKERDRRTSTERDRRTLTERDRRTPIERDRRTLTDADRRTLTERDRLTPTEPDHRTPTEPDRRTLTERDRRTPIERVRHSRSPVRPPTQSRSPPQNRPPTQNRPRSPSRDHYRDSRHLNASGATRPADGNPSRPEENNRSPRENRDYSRYRPYPTQQQRWQRNVGPYTDYYRGPPPFSVVRHPYWQDIPPPMHYGYIWTPRRPQLPPPYRGPYPPYGPGPNFHGYQ